MRPEESPGAGLSSVPDRVGEGRQACGEVGVLHVDACRDVELYGREVPYAAYAGGDEHIRLNLALPLSRVKEAFDRMNKYVFNAK